MLKLKKQLKTWSMHYIVYCLEQNAFNSAVIPNFKNVKGYINTE